MEPYRIDFTMHRDHEMVLWRDQGIKRDELEEVELQMLQAGAIPRLLPVEWFEMDGHISFHYKLTGKRMLAQRLSLRPFTMNDYYMLVLAVIEALEDCKQYMLRTEGMLLHENFIFIGEQWEEIALTYVPLRDGSRHGAARESLLALAVRWTSHIDQVDGTGLQKLFQALNDPAGTLVPVRKLLLALLSEPYQLHDAIKGKTEEEIPVQRSPKPETTLDWHPSHDSVPWERYPPDIRDDEDDDKQEEDMRIKGESSRTKWYAGALIAVLIAVAWRYGFFHSPSPASASVSAGISLLLIGAGFAWMRKYNGEQKEPERDPTKEDKPGIAKTDAEFGGKSPGAGRSEADDRVSGSRWGAMEQSGNDAVYGALKEEYELEMPDSRLLAGYAPHSAGPVAPIQAQSCQDVTVMLGRKEAAADAAGAGIPYLERTSGKGQAERVWLNKEKTVIGRTEESADYVDREEGLSRSHIEIGRDETSCSARDLGSRNGSLLNGQMMVPYKVYPLKAGDQLQLAGHNGPMYRLCEE